MALAQPAMVLVTSGQDATVTVTLSTYTSISGWTVAATMRAYDGGPVLATGTAVATDTGSVASWVITFLAADLTQPPGAYIWYFERTNAGAAFFICDASAFRIVASGTKAYPTLTNLSEYLAHVGESETVSAADAKFYSQLISAVETFVRRWCGRQFFYASYTEKLDSPVQGNLWVRETPIWSITSINFDPTGGYGQITDSFASTTLLTAGQDYFFRVDNPDGKGYQGEVFATRRGGFGWWTNRARRYWPGMLATSPEPIPGAFKLIYVGGYAVIPDDLKLAIWQIVADRKHARTTGGVGFQSESMEGYSYSLGSESDVLRIGDVRSILSTYRSVGSFFA